MGLMGCGQSSDYLCVVSVFKFVTIPHTPAQLESNVLSSRVQSFCQFFVKKNSLRCSRFWAKNIFVKKFLF